MSRKWANEFEVSLQRAVLGETVDHRVDDLLAIAHSVSAIPVPPPPRDLAAGRRQLATEAARLRTNHSPRRKPVYVPARMRLASALLATLILVTLLPGLAFGVASSDAGSPLYALKLLAREARLWMTTDPQARTDLQVSHTQEELGEIATALEQGESIAPSIATRAEKRLGQAVDAVSADSDIDNSAPRSKLVNALQNCHRIMMEVLNGQAGLENEPLHRLMRSMEQARQELHPGAGQPEGEQGRARNGTPPDDQEFGPRGAARPTAEPHDTPAADSGPPPGSPRVQPRARATAATTPVPAATPQAEGPAAPQGNGRGEQQAQQGPGDSTPASHQGPGKNK